MTGINGQYQVNQTQTFAPAQQQVVYVQNNNQQTAPTAYAPEQVQRTYQANGQVPAQGVLQQIPPVYQQPTQQAPIQQQPVQQQVQYQIPGLNQQETAWIMEFEAKFQQGYQPNAQEVQTYEIIAQKVQAARQGIAAQNLPQPVQYVQNNQPVQYVQQPPAQQNYAGQTPVAIANQSGGGYPIDANEDKFPIEATLGGALFGAVIGAKKSGKPILGALVGGTAGFIIGQFAK